ncbi:aromatic acid exporter family protein [Streptomyces sp. NPDC052036]|uniref:aromatic acid exporter family protein n=1 Tax=Streptomyces sp. NPDC052036 TaxID=3155171 RepID=UPI003443AA98
MLSRERAVAAVRLVRQLAHRVRVARRGRVVHGAKALLAALLAWGAVSLWSPEERPYLAVATALLMGNASTVYRSVTQSAQNVAARVAGLVLALVTARLLGATTAAVAVIVVIAVLAGPRRSADDRVQVAAIAVIGLAASAADPMGSLVSSVLQTLVGAVVGILVNALVLPPLYLEESDSAVRSLAHAMGTLLHDMGVGLAQRRLSAASHGWLHRARRLEERLAHAQEQVQQADESLRWNTRCVAQARRGDTTSGEAFQALRGVSLQVRGIARTLVDNASDSHADHHLGQQFLDRYAETLQWAGAAVRAFVEPSASNGGAEMSPRERLRGAIEGALDWHETMTGLIVGGSLARPGAWHVYGSLMTDVERLLADLDRAHMYAKGVGDSAVR